MTAQHKNHAISDSLKRTRDAPMEDSTPDLVYLGSRKKRNVAKNEDLSSTNTATTNYTGETVQAIALRSHLTTTNPGDIGIGSGSSDTNTVRGRQNNIPDDTPSKPTLQTLPRELRNLIYEFLAATEERIVLGRRMLGAEKSHSTDDLDDCFKQAVALHPLSMTCRQFREEFQEVHVEASEPRWVLLVNNFDLEQLRVFSHYIQLDEYIIVSGDYDEDFDPRNVPDYDPEISLRLQLDDDALRSASELCQYVYSDRKGAAPESLIDRDFKILSVAEVITTYVPRTTAAAAAPRTNKRKSMTLEEAQKIDTMLKGLRGNVENMPRYDWQGFNGPFGRQLRRVPFSFAYKEQCWFEPFYKAFKSFRDEEIGRRHRWLDRTYSRIMMDGYEDEDEDE